MCKCNHKSRQDEYKCCCDCHGKSNMKKAHCQNKMNKPMPVVQEPNDEEQE